MKSVFFLIAMILIAGVAAVDESAAATEIKTTETTAETPAIVEESAADDSSESAESEESSEEDILDDADSTLESSESDESEATEQSGEENEESEQSEDNSGDSDESIEDAEDENDDNEDEEEDESELEDSDSDFWRRRRRRRRRFKASKVTIDNVWNHLQAAEKKCKIPQSSGTKPYCRRSLYLRGCPSNMSYFDRVVAMRKHCWHLAEVKAIFALATAEPLSECKYRCKNGHLKRWPDEGWFGKKEKKLRDRVFKGAKKAVGRIFRGRGRRGPTVRRAPVRRSRSRYGRFRGRVEDQDQSEYTNEAENVELSQEDPHSAFDNTILADDAEVSDAQWESLIKSIAEHNQEDQEKPQMSGEEVNDEDMGGGGWWCCFGWC